MRALSEQELLAVWEAAEGRHAIDRGLALLGATTEDATSGTLADLPIAERDRRLLQSRTALFGTDLNVVADCRTCGDTMEFSFSAAGLQGSGHGSGPVEARHDGLCMTLRPPTSRDLAAVAYEPAETAPGRLIERLLLRVEDEAGNPVVRRLDDHALAAAGEALRQATPDSEIMLDVVCPNCGAEDALLFDPLTHFWAEVAAAARRTLQDVHGLASAYGWTESEILGLSPVRRRHYLELAAL